MSEKDVKYDQVEYFELLIISTFCMPNLHTLLPLKLILSCWCTVLVFNVFNNLNSGFSNKCNF